MEIKTDYRLKIVITPKPLIWEDVEGVRYFTNPITFETFGKVYEEKTYFGNVFFMCHKFETNEITTHSTFIQACGHIFRLWQAEIEAKIAELATLSVELR